MSDTLKNCPFCSSNHCVIKDRYFVECRECNARSALYPTEELAIKMWNTRDHSEVLKAIDDCPTIYIVNTDTGTRTDCISRQQLIEKIKGLK
jgi:hypothetical protein